MVDVAPTILHLYGLDRPESMEGRQMESAGSTRRPGSTRVSFLVNANEDGLFRDSQVGPSMTTVLVIACVLAVGGVLLDRLRTRTPKWARRGAWPLTLLALGLIAFLDATYLAGPLHFGRHGGAAPYWLFVVGVAVLLTAMFLAVGHLISVRVRRRRCSCTRCSSRSSSIIVLHVVDLVTGAQPRMEHGVRVLADHRHPVRGRGQHHVLATRGGRGAVRRPVRVAASRHASGTRVAVGVLVVTIVVMGVPGLGQRLRRRALRAPRLRAARLDAARAPCACAHRRRDRRRSWWPRSWRSVCSTSCVLPISAPTWASSSRRSAPTSTAPRS